MTQTVNATLLEHNDRLLLDAIKEKRAEGWTVEQIARYYNIYNGQFVHGTPDDTVGTIPPKLFGVA